MTNFEEKEKELLESPLSTSSEDTDNATTALSVDQSNENVNHDASQQDTPEQKLSQDGNSSIPSDDSSNSTSSSAPSQRTGTRRKKPNPVLVRDVRDELLRLGISVSLNVISGMVEIAGLPSQYSKENAANVLPSLLTDVFKSKGKSSAKQGVEDGLVVIADENRFNPVFEMIIRTVYTGVDCIRTLEEILGVENDPRSCKLLRKWLHQTVAMALNDDKNPFGADGVLVLQGDQGEGKTYFFAKLSVTPDLFAEGVSIDLNNKDSIIQSTGVWIAELGELDSTLKREQSSLKAFITSRRDTYRMPYARAAIRRPRRTSFCATVNPLEFLNDETGSRRFWVIPVKKIDIDRLKTLTPEWMMQMWRQVYEQLYCPNPQGFRLTPAERADLLENNRSFEKPLPGEIEVMDGINFSEHISNWHWYSVTEVMDALFIKGITSSQIGKVLMKLSKRNSDVKMTNTHNVKRYFLPRLR